MKFIGIISILIVILTACKKDKLEGKSAALNGKWKWDYSFEKIESNSGVTTNTFLASDYPNNYYIELKKKGTISFFEDQTVIDKYAVFFNLLATDESPTYDTRFSIYLDGDEGNVLSGSYNSVLLKCSSKHLPLEPHSEGNASYSYGHYYSKIE